MIGFGALLGDQQQILGLDHPDAFITRNNIAFLRGESGQSTQALIRLEARPQQRHRELGPDPLDAYKTRNNIASLLWGSGHAPQALTALKALL